MSIIQFIGFLTGVREMYYLNKAGFPLPIGSTRSSPINDREPVWQVVGVVGIDPASYMIIFDCQKSRVAIE